MGFRTLVSPWDDAADELARRKAPLVPSAIPCSLSPLISCVHFSRTGGVLYPRSSLTHRVPQFPSKNLCSLVTVAVSSLVYAATEATHCSVLISLGLAKSKSFVHLLRTLVLGHISLHSELFSYGRFAPLAVWQFPVSLRPMVQALGSWPDSGAPWPHFPPCPHPLEGSRNNNNNNNSNSKIEITDALLRNKGS